MPSNPIRLVVFDWDGTVANSTQLIVDSWLHGFAAAGMSPLPAEADIRATIGLHFQDTINQLAPGRDAAFTEVAVAAYREFWRPRETDIPCYPDAVDVIRELQPRVKMAVATGKSRRGLDMAFDVTALGPCFTASRTADEAARGKPHPDMINDVLAAAGVEPEATVMVGDSPLDMKMAVAAGVRALGVGFGVGTPVELCAGGAEAVASDWQQLRALLLDMIG